MVSYAKKQSTIDRVRIAGTHVTAILQLIAHAAQPDISLLTLEAMAQEYMDAHGVRGAFKGYEGFPANLCLSLNDCIAHGIPDETLLCAGDLLKIDVGVVYEGGIADAAVSCVVGGDDANPAAAGLIDATKIALDAGVCDICHGYPLLSYGRIVNETMKSHGYSVVRTLTGHGVGDEVHEPPHVFNYPDPRMDRIFFEKNMLVALEPLTAIGSSAVTTKKGNDRNLYTTKADLGAQREYTILVTDEGYEILAGVTERAALVV